MMEKCIFSDCFQSTLPVGERPPCGSGSGIQKNFNPRSPWGERPAKRQGVFFYRSISIHAPRGGSDLSLSAGWKIFRPYFNPRSPWGERQPRTRSKRATQVFPSTLPVGGATGTPAGAASVDLFHSPLPGGVATAGRHGKNGTHQDFNPRSPWGERPGTPGELRRHGHFNPRSPWGERPL